jgi:hypothetical protein
MFTEKQTPTQAASERQGTPGVAGRRDIAWFGAQLARAKRTGQFTEAARLSPALAEYLITHHMPKGSNRNLRPTKVSKLAEAIRRGDWNQNTHQGIAFATDGTVNDGQHRIHAVAQAAVAIEIPMTFGQPRDAFEVIDQDITARTAGDLIQMADCGVASYNLAAAAARLILHIRKGGTPQAIRWTASKPEILNFCRENADALNLAIHDGRSMATGMRERVSPANLAVGMFFIRASGPSALHLETFREAIRSGADLKATSPLLILREGLRAGSFGGHLRNGQDRRVHEAAAVVKAWNLWRQSRSIKGRQALGYDVNTPFPTVG